MLFGVGTCEGSGQDGCRRWVEDMGREGWVCEFVIIWVCRSAKMRQ